VTNYYFVYKIVVNRQRIPGWRLLQMLELTGRRGKTMVKVIAPPSLASIEQALPPERIARLMTLILRKRITPVVSGRYCHWDDLRHRQPPSGLDHAAWWLGIKSVRAAAMRELPLRDAQGRALQYMHADPVIELLHEIDIRAGMAGPIGREIVEPDFRESYLYRSLRDEGIDSSLLEGAATTRREALAMLEEGRTPRSHGERMVLNNFWALERVREWKDEPLTEDRILELHEVVTRDTLSDPAESGRLRRPELDDDVVVGDAAGHLLYRPPLAAELPERLERLLAFANMDPAGARPYLHPVVHAVVLHLQFALDHPFTDGNGRVARALFYWALARHGYRTCEYVSISSYVRRARAGYQRAFLLTETDDADATYFLVHQLKILRDALVHLERHVADQTRRIDRLADMLLDSGLNDRQIALLAGALRNPRARFTIEGHRKRHGVVYQTARKDLMDLAAQGLLVRNTVGRKFVFRVADDLEGRLRRR